MMAANKFVRLIEVRLNSKDILLSSVAVDCFLS